MQQWMNRARATTPMRTLKRGSSDLPTLENLDAHEDYLRSLLAEDASMGWRKLREAMKTKSFLVTTATMQSWLERQSLLPYQPQLLQHWNSFPRITYTQMKEFLEQEHGVSCSIGTMKWFMQSKFQGMEVLTIAELDAEEYTIF